MEIEELDPQTSSKEEPSSWHCSPKTSTMRTPVNLNAIGMRAVQNCKISVSRAPDLVDVFISARRLLTKHNNFQMPQTH